MSLNYLLVFLTLLVLSLGLTTPAVAAKSHRQAKPVKHTRPFVKHAGKKHTHENKVVRKKPRHLTHKHKHRIFKLKKHRTIYKKCGNCDIPAPVVPVARIPAKVSISAPATLKVISPLAPVK